MFNEGAEEAAKLYTSIFPDSKILSESHMGANADRAFVEFELCGTRYMAYNGGSYFSFSEGTSMFVSCESQAEVDEYWEKLLADGGEESQCGWLKDRFGLSWQIVPTRLMELMGDPDPDKAKRVVDAMMQMVKLDIAELEKAAAG